MSMFHKNPAAARDKAVAELMKIEAVVVEHKTKRAALLLDEGDVTVIASHDIAVAANERAAQILRERIAALTDEVRRQERERQEAERQSAITSIVAPRLSKIEALATAAEQSLAKFFDSYSKLQTAVKDINGADWRASVSRPTHAYYFSISEVERRLATALDRASHALTHAVSDFSCCHLSSAHCLSWALTASSLITCLATASFMSATDRSRSTSRTRCSRATAAACVC
jgi:hypothetical protein